MQNEIVFSSLDLLVASCNSLAKAHNLKPDSVFTVDLFRSKIALFFMTQYDEELVKKLSKFVLESVERDNQKLEEIYDEIEIQGHPI